MKLTRIGIVAGTALGVAVTAVSTGWTTSQPALAAGGATASLGCSGSAKGDISLDAGDVDHVTVDLVEGMTFTAKFTSTFAADVTFTNPDGTVIDLGWGTGATRTAKAYAVTTSGRYDFRIAASGAAQGTYSLKILGKCPKKVTIRGAAGDAIHWGMQRGASISGKIMAAPARSWDPVIASVVGPSGSSLPAPVNGVKGLVKMPKVTAAADGTYTMTIQGGAAGGTFTGSLLLKSPKVKAAVANLSNGLTAVSYETGGLKSLFLQQCAACHAWVGSGAQVKPHAKAALARILSGNMPQGGKRLTASEIDLLRQWMATGMAP